MDSLIVWGYLYPTLILMGDNRIYCLSTNASYKHYIMPCHLMAAEMHSISNHAVSLYCEDHLCVTFHQH